MPHTKLQRWTDLIASLLSRRYGASFLELTHDVPAYAAGRDPEQRDTVKRAFERDKVELREFGIPIDTMDADDPQEIRYALRPRAFYLPYLALPDDAAPSPVPGPGYRELGRVTFTPDELDLVAKAVSRLDQLGDDTLVADARAAANKLAFDLPLFDRPTDVHLLDAGEGDPKHFAAIADAMRRRKVLSFDYRKPDGDQPIAREVEPLGLFFVNAHWYLAARDRARDELRNFRVSRMSRPRVKAGSARDFDAPAGFDLRVHARAREPWDLGDGPADTAVVRFTGTSGAAVAAASAGEEVAGAPGLRAFPVRRMDAFARWLLSLGGDARPESPPALVEAFEAGVAATLSTYRKGT